MSTYLREDLLLLQIAELWQKAFEGFLDTFHFGDLDELMGNGLHVASGGAAIRDSA